MIRRWVAGWLGGHTSIIEPLHDPTCKLKLCKILSTVEIPSWTRVWQQEQQQQPRPQQQQQPQQHPNSQKNKHMNNNNNKKTLVGCDTIEINLVVLQLLNSLKSLKFST